MDAEKFLSAGLHLDKKLDQHFLKDGRILEKEIDLADLEPSDVVLEIGAGIGNLTERIAPLCRVIAIEKDGRFIPLLKNIENASVVHGDALIEIKNLEFSKVISNIPYSISQPLLLELLKKKWDIAVLIVQKEFALKLLSGSKLAIIVNECCEFGIESFIPGKAFYPPAPESAIIVLRQKKLMDWQFWSFLSRIYVQKNSNVKNAAEKCPAGMAKKKVHQLSAEELKQLHKMNSV